MSSPRNASAILVGILEYPPEKHGVRDLLDVVRHEASFVRLLLLMLTFNLFLVLLCLECSLTVGSPYLQTASPATELECDGRLMHDRTRCTFVNDSADVTVQGLSVVWRGAVGGVGSAWRSGVVGPICTPFNRSVVAGGVRQRQPLPKLHPAHGGAYSLRAAFSTVLAASRQLLAPWDIVSLQQLLQEIASNVQAGGSLEVTDATTAVGHLVTIASSAMDQVRWGIYRLTWDMYAATLP